MWSSGQSAGVTLVEWEHVAHISALIEVVLIMGQQLDWTHNTEHETYNIGHYTCCTQ